MSDADYLTAAQAAARLGLSLRTVRRRIADGSLASVRIGRAVRIPAAAIEEEPEARNTMEQACDSLRMMRRHGWESAEVVSSASELPRAGLILSRLPLAWRVHAAPAMEPEGAWTRWMATTIEIVKTAHYLVWSRQMEKCEIQGIGSRE